MSHLFTTEHDSMRSGIQRFVRQELDPETEAWEAQGQAPLPALFRRAGQLGLLGINKPERFGGLGLDFSYVMVAAEELGHAHCASIPFAIGAHLSAIPALTIHGSDALREEFLVPAISGEAVASIGVSETTAGSDVSATRRGRDGTGTTTSSMAPRCGSPMPRMRAGSACWSIPATNGRPIGTNH